MTTNLWMPVGPFGFDGFGVNDYAKDHRPCVAMLTQNYRGCRNVGDLLAAAPDLLAAAELALACIEQYVPATVFAPRDALRAAIAKAHGEIIDFAGGSSGK